MSELFLEIVNMSISASYLVLAVLLLRLVLKKAPKWVSVLLWGFVAVRLICPVSFESVLSLIPSAQTISPQIMKDWTPEISTSIEHLNTVDYPNITVSFAQNPYASANPLQILIPLAAIAWLVGIAAMLIYTAISYMLLRRKVTTAVLLKDNIFQSENVASPFVLGIIKPKIYLPFQMDGQNLGYVIAHEQAHIRRKDHWWKPLGFLLLAIHWFNPLMWLGYILLCRDIELACDEKVIKTMDSEAKADYTQALVACSISRRSIAACPLAFGEVGVKARVKSVMNYRKPAFWIVMAAVITCIAVAVCFLTDPKRASDPLPNIYSHAYVVEEITYEGGMYSFSVTAGENTPIYTVSENMTLASQGEISQMGVWAELGRLEEVKLTKKNFDDLFITPGNWVDGTNAEDIRNRTVNAWQLVYNQEILYYVLQQKNGEVYLAYGYQEPDKDADPGSFNEHIRWLFKLGLDTSNTSGIVARSGNNTVPMLSFPKGTAIAEYAANVHWLTIDPGEALVPFTVWKDGEEIRGFYNAFDAETFMPVEYFVPSGLDSQTYLFQNADPAREYIVLATFSTEPDAVIYAFGAKFDSTDVSFGSVDADVSVEHRFTAEVLEVHKDYLLVEPVYGSTERRSADKIEVPLKDKTSWPIPQVGDLVTVVYNGELQETYPARITKVYRLEVIAVEETIKGNLKTYYKNTDGTWQVDGRTYQYRLEITGRMPNAAGISAFVYLSNIPEISFDRAWKAAGYSSNSEDYFQPEEAVLVGTVTETWSNPMLPA